MAMKKKGGAKKKSAAKKPAARKSASRPAAKKRTASKKTAVKKGGAKKRATKRASAAAKKTKRAPNPAFMKPMQPDDALGAVVGGGAMPRTEVTKKVWAYIKRHGLQDAKQRRMINADEKLGKVFGGKKQVSMFDMTKLVNQHMSPA